jgi:hypothetical protein
VELAPEGTTITPASLWYPLWAMHKRKDRTVPMDGAFYWHLHHAATIEQSKQATDPFPDGVLT